MAKIQDMKRTMMTLTGAMAIIVATGPAQAVPTPFLYEYRGDRMPHEADTISPATSPTWTATQQATGFDYALDDHFTEDPSFLRVDMSEAPPQHRASWEMEGSSWELSDAFTVAFRIRIVETTTGANNFLFEANEGGVRRMLFRADEDAAGFFGGSDIDVEGFDPTEWNTYWITGEKEEGVWSFDLYLNDDPTVLSTSAGLTTPFAVDIMRFGDMNTSTHGTFDIDYIRWNNTAAIPVPEPASLALLGLGALAMAGRRRCRRSV